MMVSIEKKLISKNYTKGAVIKPAWIVIHETANTGKGANADAHFNYWNTNDNAQSSVHFVVDDRKIIQLLELNNRAWHVGDNKGHSGITNDNALGIEICVNNDGDYERAVTNAVDLVKHLLSITGLTIDKVVTHKDSSGKNCPAIMLKNNKWQDFKSRVAQTAAELTSVNDIVWELAERGILTDKELWLQKLAEDGNSYWLARKTVKFLQSKGV